MADSDEDELLQQALHEQGGGRRFRAPPPPIPRRASRQRDRRSVEDDDDSDVEMLSISSGDEDNGNQKAAPRGRAGGRGGDRGWEGEEPDCWKRVDELSVSGYASKCGGYCISFESFEYVNEIYERLCSDGKRGYALTCI